jgi:hypothetical protein
MSTACAAGAGGAGRSGTCHRRRTRRAALEEHSLAALAPPIALLLLLLLPHCCHCHSLLPPVSDPPLPLSLSLSARSWIELESVRAGEPERMTADERFALDKLDTPDGLLKTVLKHAQREASHPWMTLTAGVWV